MVSNEEKEIGSQKWLPLQKQLDRVSKAQRAITHLAKDKQRGIERGMPSCFREIQNNSRQYRADPPKDLSDKKLQAFKERLKVIYNKLDKRLTKLRRREERNQMTKFIQNVHASYFDGTKKFFQKINPDKRKNNKQPSSGEAVKRFWEFQSNPEKRRRQAHRSGWKQPSGKLLQNG